MKVIFKFLFFVMILGICQGAFALEPAPVKPNKCVQIYYDYSGKSNFDSARAEIIPLQNLIGHFPNIQQYIIPIGLYQKNQLNRCDASIYLASNYENSVPSSFVQDFVNTSKNVMWIGYHIEQIPQIEQKKLWSASFTGLAKINWNIKDSKGRPGVYHYYEYKGETFERCSYPYSADTTEFKQHYTYDYDIALMKLLTPQAKDNVMSWAKLSIGNTKTPFILRKNNHWYVAENPFTFICEGDRYFIFADVLFDVLNEKPQGGGKKYALVRYEDVSPGQDLEKMDVFSDMFARLKVPFAISLIPIYVDSMHIYHDNQSYMEIKDNRRFIAALKRAKKRGASFIMHGVSHQYNSHKNPYSGVTGEDFEFWNEVDKKPIKEDSVKYVLERVTKGMQLISDEDFNISAWISPHYIASPLDETIFGQVFTWNITRGSYAVCETCNLNPLSNDLTFNLGNLDQDSQQKRLDNFANLKLKVDHYNSISQLFPYPIYGDYYGRRIIPENLGNIQPFYNNMVLGIRTVDDILKDAKRYRVLRDVWASLFIHDLMLNTKNNNGIANDEGDTSELERLINTIKGYGYEFVDLDKWTATHLSIPRRPEPIEIYPAGHKPSCS